MSSTVVIHTSGSVGGGSKGTLYPPVKGIETDPSIAPVDPPSDGDRWIAGAGAVGVWAGLDPSIVEYEDSTATWVVTQPNEGDLVVNEDDPDAVYIFDATAVAWVRSYPLKHEVDDGAAHATTGQPDNAVVMADGADGVKYVTAADHANQHGQGGAAEVAVEDLATGLASGHFAESDGSGALQDSGAPAVKEGDAAGGDLNGNYPDPTLATDELPHAGGGAQGVSEGPGGGWIVVTGVTAAITTTKISDLFVQAAFDAELTAGAAGVIEWGIQRDAEASPPVTARITQYQAGGGGGVDLQSAAVQRQDAALAAGAYTYRLYVNLAGAQVINHRNAHISVFSTKVE